MGGRGVGGVDGGVGVVVVGGRRQGTVGRQWLVRVQVLVVLKPKLAQTPNTEGGVSEGGRSKHVHGDPEWGGCWEGGGRGRWQSPESLSPRPLPTNEQD